MQLKVLDLSHHNDGPIGGPIDFAAIAAIGVRGIIHKASQGTATIDRMYAGRRQAVLDAGLLWGAYHFADGSDPEVQAKHFLDIAKPDAATLMALDYEPNGASSMNIDGARAFLETLKAELGRPAVLYSGNLIKETLDEDEDGFFGGHRLWLAQYGDHPKWPAAWSAPWLHQFSGDGVNNHGIHVPGVNPAIAGKLDMNAYAGTDEQLAQEWAA